MKYHDHNSETERQRVRALTNTTHKPHLTLWNCLPEYRGMWVAEGGFCDQAEDWCDSQDAREGRG